MAEAVVGLHMSSHVLLVFVLLSTVIALPTSSLHFADHLGHRVKNKCIEICNKVVKLIMYRGLLKYHVIKVKENDVIVFTF